MPVGASFEVPVLSLEELDSLPNHKWNYSKVTGWGVGMCVSAGKDGDAKGS